MADRMLKVRRPMLRGDDVVAVQNQLTALGYDPGPADGIYGPLADAAVRAFQEAAGVDVDGIVGPDTFAALAGAGASEGTGGDTDPGGESGNGSAGHGWDGLRELIESSGVRLDVDWGALGAPDEMEEVPEALVPYFQAADEEDDAGEMVAEALFGDEDDAGAELYASADEQANDEYSSDEQGSDEYAAADVNAGDANYQTDGDENYG